MSYQRTACRLPQAAELVGKVMAALLLTVPPVPLDAVVLPADCVPDHWVSPAVTATRIAPAGRFGAGRRVAANVSCDADVPCRRRADGLAAQWGVTVLFSA